MRNKALKILSLTALALAALSCAKEAPESEFAIKARSSIDPGVASSDIQVAIRRSALSDESRRIVDFRPPLYLSLNNDGTLDLQLGLLVESIIERVFQKRVSGSNSRTIIVDSKVSLNDMVTRNPLKVTHVWEIYEPEPTQTESLSPMTMAGEPPPQSRPPAEAPKKRQGFVCAKFSGNAKKSSVESMEIWLAPSESPYAAAFQQR